MRVKIPRDKLTAYHWIGSHFHDCIDFYGVVFSAILIELLEWGYTFVRF